ncbi:venom serine carboxypeptidase-like [Vanessa cardui]|uniref:venom serine carboxypeptidase-like n=1 Tax=Vanessa cardui TaxID=171605 RepID=UPI001F148845|nr:venom serine carboxypeptidase-like [Vanessa cardui]
MFLNGLWIAFTITASAVTTHALKPALLLTPLIKQNKTEEARISSLVDPESFLNVTSYSGFLTVDETHNSNLFFWYFPASNKKGANTEWMIWLQGGPGATSLVALFSEMGPFEYINDQLKLRETSWCKDFSMVFIDNPVGVGFSFTDNADGYSTNMDMYSENLYRAVKQLVVVYPELGPAPLFVAGESYAGRYVPGLAHKILEGMKTSDNSINLKGIIMGNPIVDRQSIVDFTRVFYNWGLVDSQGALAAKSLQEQFEKAIKDGDSVAASGLRERLLDKLQIIASKDETYNLLKDHVVAHVKDFVPYITQESIRDKIHVGAKKFDFHNDDVHIRLKTDFLASVSPKVEELLEHCRVLIYCGQLDLTTPCVLTAESRRARWRWSRRAAFLAAPRTPWWFNGTVAGYVKSGGGFTEVQVNGAGHLVPIDKPVQAKSLVTNFILNRDLPMPPNYKINDEDVPPYEEYTDLSHYGNSEFKIGLISSVVVNVLLVMGAAAGLVMVIRWKRQNDFFYSPLNDGILTMT